MRPPSLPPQTRLQPGAPGWPAQLSELVPAPVHVRVAGTLPDLSWAVAIVGTRFADPDALAFARRLGSACAARGAVVVSGGALGIDAAAHEGALAVGGPTLAVLATGLARPYPPAHAGLFRSIAAAGALLTEAEDTAQPWKSAFLRRNRLIAALAQSVVVVQAPLRSGALSTAAWAKRLKRPVFAVPHAPWDTRGQGCLALIQQGARICTSAADVLSLRPSDGAQLALSLTDGTPGQARSTKDDAGLSESHRRVLRALADRKHPDELVSEVAMTAASLHEALLRLTLAGLVRKAADGTYERVRD
jgi:DNA processing protein